MPQILVWKCPRTGKLFEDKSKYSAHLKSIRSERAVRRKLESDNNELQQWFTEFRSVERTIAELPQAIIDNQYMFWRAAARNNVHDWAGVGKKSHKKVVMPIPKLVKFTQFDCRWDSNISNTHSCPIGGVMNWGGRSDGPRDYPGWRGIIEWEVEIPKEWKSCYIGGDLFDGSTVYTGTGGGGGYNETTGCQTFGYGCNIFAHDWPGLYAVEMRKQSLAQINRDKQNVWRIVGGNSTVTPVTELPDDWHLPLLDAL